MKYFLSISILVLSFFVSLEVKAQQKELTRILFVFDASNSMNGTWERNSKISVARKILIEAVDSLKTVDNLELALRIYGHQTQIIMGRPETQDCNDTKLEVPFSKSSHADIQSKIRSVVPKGTTPIALSLEKSAGDFPDKKANNVIILITDGIEACDGDPCRIATKLKAKEIGVKPFVVGLGMDLSYLEKFNCIGTVFDATNEGDFRLAIQNVLNSALNNTTAQINLNDTSKKPSETNVAFTLYDQKGRVKYNYQHTMNYRGNPDTLYLDPAVKYDLTVHTIPEVKKEDISLKVGEHNIIEVDAPQGHLELKMSGVNGYSIYNAVIRQDGKMETIHVQNFGQRSKLICGKYDIEVLTLPRLYFDVDIKQSKTSYIQVPHPGSLDYEYHNLQHAAIYLKDGDKLTWIYNLDLENRHQRLELLPGKYRVVYRSDQSWKTNSTKQKDFTIYSEESTKITLE